MKFVFVVGGSYKSFYLNYISRIKDADLLIFNQGIFYDFDYNKEQVCPNASMELLNLNRKLNCPIIVYCSVVKDGIKSKCFLLCNKQKLSIINEDRDIYLKIRDEYILIGNRLYVYSQAFATISILDRFNDDYNTCKRGNNRFICTKKKVLVINKGKVYRKFQKCCYFILKKNK